MSDPREAYFATLQAELEAEIEAERRPARFAREQPQPARAISSPRIVHHQCPRCGHLSYTRIERDDHRIECPNPFPWPLWWVGIGLPLVLIILAVLS